MAFGASLCAKLEAIVIELLLYFALGFLCAMFLTALVAPAVLRRTTMLTRRRIEASVPLTLEEIRAEKDSLRAEHAVERRQLELELKAAKERASNEAVKYARGRKDIKSVAAEREEIKSTLVTLEADARQLREEVRRRDDRLQALSAALTQTEQMLQVQKDGFEKLAREFEDTSFSSSARQIELVARESEIDRLNSDITALKGLRKSSDRVTREADARVRSAENGMLAEKRRAEELNAKVLQLLSTLSDRDERLERREKEVVRLRERLKPILTGSARDDTQARLADLQIENSRLEAELAELNERLSFGSGTKQAPKRGNAMAESKERLAASQALRNKISELAAEVVQMTAVLEGANSPINRALDKGGPQANGQDLPLSLADRVLDLRKKAGA